MNQSHSELDINTLRDSLILNSIYKYSKKVISLSICFGIMVFLYQLTKDDIYSSQGVYALSDQESKLDDKLSSLSSLASFAGVSLGAGGTDEIELIKEKIYSRDFLKTIIDHDPIQAAKIFALEKIDIDNNFYEYNNDIFEPDSLKISFEKVPFEELYKVYHDLIDIDINKASGMINLSFSHRSPIFASEIIKTIIFLINKDSRDKQYSESSQLIVYLKDLLLNTQNIELKTAFNQLLLQEERKLMLVNVREEFLLETISSPFVPIFPAGPKRFLISVISTLFFYIALTLFIPLAEFLRNIFRVLSTRAT